MENELFPSSDKVHKVVLDCGHIIFTQILPLYTGQHRLCPECEMNKGTPNWRKVIWHEVFVE